jgi:hypothetical protein
MTAVRAGSYLWAIEILREDEAPVGQREVAPDWGPWQEWVRWLAVRAGQTPETAFTGPGDVLPMWDETRGGPSIRGVRVRAAQQETAFGLEPFREPARVAIAQLVAEGRLAAGDLVRWRALAFAREGPARDEPGRLGKQAAPPIPVQLTRLGPGAGPAGEDDDPVLIPEAVLGEVSALTLEATGRETGGILIGHLCRDEDTGRLFAKVTAQLPARHTEACSTKLTFTPATWTDVGSAIALRRTGEIMLGWWHSHPVRAWCRDCAEECRPRCTLAEGFLSADDRRLHRMVFPRAFSLALLASDVSEEGPTFTLFGWRRGLLVTRAFTRLGGDDDGHA